MITGLALVAAQVPLAGRPLIWVETFFHEISHGLAALATGGTIVGFTLGFDGSGVCRSVGGWGPAIAFAGYPGAALFGALLYRTAVATDRRTERALAGSAMALIALVWLLWGQGAGTLIIIASIEALFALGWLLGRSGWARLVLQFVGASAALSAVRSPLAVLASHDGGSDAAVLSRMTGLPQGVWVAAWIVVALAAVWMMWRFSRRRDSRRPG